MAGRLDGKITIITGTGSGMGRAAALQFAREGARVVGCDIQAESAEETVRAARAQGFEIESLHPCDLSRPGEAQRLIDFALQRHGGIDALYNNGAMAYFAWFEDMSYDDHWRRTIVEELDIVFHACKAAWPHLIARGGGSIINVGSVSAKQCYEVLPGIAHSTAKGGVLAMTRHLAMEGGQHNIRVNTISPGLVETAQTRAFIQDAAWREPMMRKLMIKRVGQPEDVAPLAVYLASDESRWVTGADFAVDGGTMAW